MTSSDEIEILEMKNLEKKSKMEKEANEPKPLLTQKASELQMPVNTYKAALESSSRSPRSKDLTHHHPDGISFKETRLHLADQFSKKRNFQQMKGGSISTKKGSSSQEDKPSLKDKNVQIQTQNPLKLQPARKQAKARVWKTSSHRLVSSEQKMILSYVFKHIKEGSRNVDPIKKVEAEFHRINKIVRNNLVLETTKSDPVQYQPEVDLTQENKDLPTTWTFFKSTICPSFFQKVYRWQKIFHSLKYNSWEFTLKDCFPKAKVEAFKHKARVVVSHPGNNQIAITGELSNVMFQELLDGGFIYSFPIEAWTSKMTSTSFVAVNHFSSWLYQNRSYGEVHPLGKPIGVRVFSTPPLFIFRCWKTISEMLEDLPKIYPSLIVFQETADFSTEENFHAGDIKMIDDQDNKKERALRLQQIEDITWNHEGFYPWRSDPRILCLSRLDQARSHIAKQFTHGPLKSQMHLQSDDEERPDPYEDYLQDLFQKSCSRPLPFYTPSLLSPALAESSKTSEDVPTQQNLISEDKAKMD